MNMKRLTGWLLALCLLVFSFGAMAEITEDRAGNPITLPQEINTIFSMAPSTTEVLVALGMADKLIGIDTYSTDIEGIPADLPTFSMMTPDIEQIAALKPDVLFATGMSLTDGVDNFAPLTDLGICIIYIPSSTSLEAIMADTLFLGEVLGKADEAQAINDDMQARIDAIAAIGATVETPKTVYFEISAAPYLYSFGTDTFLNEMIELIGAKNLLADQEGWLSVSEEIVLAGNPDVIFTNVNYIDDPIGEIKARAGWDAITAVQEDAVFAIHTNASSRPNHNVITAMEEMARAIYPELFQ